MSAWFRKLFPSRDASKRKASSRGALRGVVLALLLLTACVAYLERNLTRVVLSLAQAQARVLAVRSLNEAADEIVQSGVTYEQLMSVATGQDGRIQLIQANTPEMNLLASRASLTAQEKLQSVETRTIAVPLGSALGLTLLAGSGPRIQVQILPVGSVIAQFSTEFQSAGINQTRHKISLTLKADVRLVIPTGASTVEVTTQVAVAESIIIGEVPQSFVDVNNDSDMLNLVP